MQAEIDRIIVALAATVALGMVTSPTVGIAQDAGYPYPPMNPYIPVTPPEPPAQGAGSAVPWPYNPLGTPMAPLPTQTLPPSQIPTPGITPPSNFEPPVPLPSAAAGSPWGTSTAPGYTPEPPSAPPQPGQTVVGPAVPGVNQPAPGAAPAAEGETRPQAGTEAAKKASGENTPDGNKAAGEETPGEKKTAGEAAEGEKKAEGEGQAAKKAGKGKDSKEAATGKEEKEGDEAKAGKDEKGKGKEPPEFTATAYNPIRQALFELNTKQYARSLDTLNRVLATNPNHPQAHYVRAIVLVMMRQYPGAVRDYKEVIRLIPNSELGRRAAEGLKKINL